MLKDLGANRCNQRSRGSCLSTHGGSLAMHVQQVVILLQGSHRSDRGSSGTRAGVMGRGIENYLRQHQGAHLC
jgi:hypothetical protein